MWFNWTENDLEKLKFKGNTFHFKDVHDIILDAGNNETKTLVSSKQI